MWLDLNGVREQNGSSKTMIFGILGHAARFAVYALFPHTNISIHVLWGLQKQNTVFATGKSIVNRTSNTNIGELMLFYGGGGHENAGTCQIANERAEAVLRELIAAINADDAIDGLLVQLPLPDHLDTNRIIEAIAPEKDIDGIHPMNAGRLYLGRPTLVPGTPLGVMRMLDEYEIPLEGAHALDRALEAIAYQTVDAVRVAWAVSNGDS